MLEGHPGLVCHPLPLGAARCDAGGHSQPLGCSFTPQVTFGCLPTGGDGCGTALLPPGTQGGGWRHRQGAGAAPAESQVCGTWAAVVPYPTLIMGPTQSPKTLGEPPKNLIPAGTSAWDKLSKKVAFWPGPAQPCSGSVMVAPAWWWVLPCLHGDVLGGIQPCPADGGPLFVPTVKCSMSCCRTLPPCPSNGG